MAARARPFSRFWFVLALAASLPALPPACRRYRLPGAAPR